MEKIIPSIAMAKQEYNLPFLSISIDLIQNEVLHKENDILNKMYLPSAPILAQM
jgi:hypothetical protein